MEIKIELSDPEVRIIRQYLMNVAEIKEVTDEDIIRFCLWEIRNKIKTLKP